ncbi:MAG TPA: hypothetical protein VFM30_01465 [Steroidobacteraceae bacterium]|jgi:hypothetical protein|nr:hypothetical protein [Steroidobacteraceae bacterium]
MPTPSGPNHVDLSVELAVESGQTKSVLRIRKGGAFKFRNASETETLTISSPAAEPPFVLDGCSTGVSSFDVPPHGSRTVTISEAYDDGASFSYSAQIEGSMAEDPIVIIERR